jgi:hypothetical protein
MRKQFPEKIGKLSLQSLSNAASPFRSVCLGFWMKRRKLGDTRVPKLCGRLSEGFWKRGLEGDYERELRKAEEKKWK